MLSLIESVFISMPDECFYQLDKERKERAVSLYNAGDTIVSVPGRFGDAEITYINSTTNYISVKTSAAGYVEFKLNEVGDADFLFINTVTCGPACDSQIGVYNTNTWQQVDSRRFIPQVELVDFINKEKLAEDNKTVQDIAGTLDILFFKYAFSKENDDLTVSLDIKDTMDQQSYNSIAPYIYDVVFLWNGTVYEKNNR